MKLRPATVLHLMRLAESTNEAEAASAKATLAAAHVWAVELPSAGADVWLWRLLAGLGRGVGVVVWQRPASAVVVAPDESLLLQALWCVALLRRELAALTAGMDAAARDMAAWSVAECAAARLRVDIERPLITPGAGQHITAEAREALREGRPLDRPRRIAAAPDHPTPPTRGPRAGHPRLGRVVLLAAQPARDRCDATAVFPPEAPLAGGGTYRREAPGGLLVRMRPIDRPARTTTPFASRWLQVSHSTTGAAAAPAPPVATPSAIALRGTGIICPRPQLRQVTPDPVGGCWGGSLAGRRSRCERSRRRE